MSERTCSNCNATIPDGAQFCTTCGTPAPTAAPAPAAGTDHTTVMPIAPPPAAPPAWTPGAPAAAPSPPAAPAAPTWSDPTMAQPATQAPAAYQPPPAAYPPPAPMPPTQPAPAWSQPPPPAAPPAPAPQQWQPQAPQAPQAGPPPAWGAPQPGAPQQPPWPGAAPAAVASKKQGNAFGGLLALIGAILLLVGAFTPWVRTNIQAGVSGWKVSNDAKTVVALGGVSLLLGLLAFAKVRFILFRLALLGMGIGAIVITVINNQSIGDKLDKSLNAKFGFGLILVGVGGVFLLLSGLFTKSKKVAS